MKRFIVTTLAEYQTQFWLPVGLQLQQQGHPVAFLSFDDRSTEMLEAAGLKVFSATDTSVAPPGDSPQIDELFRRFGLSNLNFWLAHERFAFGVRNTELMRRKLAAALIHADRACTEWGRDGSTEMVQELGGFLSVIGSYFAARRREIDNWFIEPSFFRGRMFFLRNSFSAIRIEHTAGVPVIPEVDRYLDDTISTGAIVVPLKDRHQYTTARKKIVNWRNARRLFEKLTDKHLHGKKQEFGNIGFHVATHARMLLNSFKLRNRYTPMEACGRFVYYPLHVPGDMALTLRTPHLLDQLALIDYICRCIPQTHRVVIKEHPAMVGAVNAERMLELLYRHDNLALLPPSTNNYKVLSASDAVVSINSKSGAEGGLIGKPVLVLGDAFYRDAPFATTMDRLQDLPDALATVLDYGKHRKSAELEIRSYFTSVWRQTVPGELYVADPQNVARFTESILAATV